MMNSIIAETPQSVYQLLMFGAKPNIKNDEGSTAAMMAGAFDNTEILRMLISRRADLNATNDEGLGVRDIADMNQSYNVLNLLEYMQTNRQEN